MGNGLPRVVVMGVAGCGKTTVGRLLAGRLGVGYVEGDELHPAANVAKMAAGTPLDDGDRAPWLDRIADRIADARAQGQGLVVACSALKRRYRDRLRRDDPALRFVHLHGSLATLAARLADRRGHYMPAALLRSQLDALEAPGVDEQAIDLDIDATPESLAAAAQRQLETLA